MHRRTLVIGLCLTLILSGEILAENQKVVLVLDVSGSMNEGRKFQAVKSYIERDLFPNLLRPNDQFTLVLFGNNPRQAFTEQIADEDHRRQILERIRNLRADDDYTDIGMAVEYLFDLLSGMKGEDVKVLFITDGKNTPPKRSPYYGRDLSVDTRFREMGKKISQEGWFIYVIGIGKETDAKHIVAAVEGSVLRETDATLQDVRVEEYLGKTEEVREKREADRKKTLGVEQESSVTGTSGWIHRWALFLGFSPMTLYVLFAIIGVGLIFGIAYFLWKLIRPIKVLAWDSQSGKSHAVHFSLVLGSYVTLNTHPYYLPVLGEEDHSALQIGRNLKGLWIRVLDATILPESSPYRDKGKHSLKGKSLELSSGEQVFIL